MEKVSDPLRKAAAAGDLPTMQAILAETPELARDWPPILSAALYGQPDAARLLLDHGADPNALSPTEHHYRPLHRAVGHQGEAKHPGHRAVLEVLLERGAELEGRGCWQRITPLALAGGAGDPEFVALLIARGAWVDLYTASVCALENEVRALLEADPLAGRVVDENGMTPLHYAAFSRLGDDDLDAAARLRRITERLLEHGADVHARMPHGGGPGLPVLHFAAPRNYAVAEVLLARGADPVNALGSFLWGEPSPVADLLLKHGADPNYYEAEYHRPLLHTRIHWGHTGAALWLLRAGANPNLTDRAGRTAVHTAVLRGCATKFVEALRDHGAELHARDAEGRTPLDLAREKGRSKLIAWFEAQSLA